MLADAFLHYGYAVIFVAAAIEGDAALVAASFLAHRGYFRLGLVILVAACGTIAINQVYFWMARAYGRQRIADMRSHRLYGRAFNLVARYRMTLVLVSRFVYGFRIAIPATCGALGMSPLAFAAVDVTGAALWGALVGTGGYAIGKLLEYIVDDLRAHEGQVAFGILVVMLALFARYGRDWLALGGLRKKGDGSQTVEK